MVGNVAYWKDEIQPIGKLIIPSVDKSSKVPDDDDDAEDDDNDAVIK